MQSTESAREKSGQKSSIYPKMLARCLRAGRVSAFNFFNFAFEDLKLAPPELELLTKNTFNFWFEHHKIHTPAPPEIETSKGEECGYSAVYRKFTVSFEHLVAVGVELVP